MSSDMSQLLGEYAPILLFLLLALVLASALVAAAYVLGPQRPNAQKTSAYECGFEAFDNARARFDVRFYLVAILFIIFDLEVAFLFPWAAALVGLALPWPIFWSMVIFLGILTLGFVYEWRKGALEWE